jgi:hypothetical protein
MKTRMKLTTKTTKMRTKTTRTKSLPRRLVLAPPA